MIGKTIAATSRPDRYSDDLTLHFTDGSSALLVATGWEADGIDVTQLSYVETMRRGCELAGEREAERVRNLAAETKRKDRAALKATMTEPEWEAWLDEHEPRWRTTRLFAEQWRSMLDNQMRSYSLLLRHQSYGG
jgi:hypothetical protein